MTQTTQPEGELFGRRLREVRQKRGLTQQAVADLAGMSLTYISNMEHGFKVPSLTTIIRLAVALDCKVMDLVGAFDKTDLRALLPK
ncbi:MAG TPA: helix-turn-helix transcriptional regulator [Thermoanaerobaculia bacterium]|nr:helix-turn-helix transcriptional regulator [Thermoanaerobaculia bacterium]